MAAYRETDRRGGGGRGARPAACGQQTPAAPDRRRPERQDLRTRFLGVALEVDRDIDFALAQQLGNLAIAVRTRRVHPVERANYPPPDVAAVVTAERDAHDLETGAVMPLDQLGDQIGGGMLVE